MGNLPRGRHLIADVLITAIEYRGTLMVFPRIQHSSRVSWWMPHVHNSYNTRQRASVKKLVMFPEQLRSCQIPYERSSKYHIIYSVEQKRNIEIFPMSVPPTSIPWSYLHKWPTPCYHEVTQVICVESVLRSRKRSVSLISNNTSLNIFFM